MAPKPVRRSARVQAPAPIVPPANKTTDASRLVAVGVSAPGAKLVTPNNTTGDSSGTKNDNNKSTPSPMQGPIPKKARHHVESGFQLSEDEVLSLTDPDSCPDGDAVISDEAWDNAARAIAMADTVVEPPDDTANNKTVQAATSQPTEHSSDTVTGNKNAGMTSTGATETAPISTAPGADSGVAPAMAVLSPALSTLANVAIRGSEPLRKALPDEHNTGTFFPVRCFRHTPCNLAGWRPFLSSPATWIRFISKSSVKSISFLDSNPTHCLLFPIHISLQQRLVLPPSCLLVRPRCS